ncbi:hypothetical protein B7463_g4441, partial [Scytalidium lignicola]
MQNRSAQQKFRHKKRVERQKRSKLVNSQQLLPEEPPVGSHTKNRREDMDNEIRRVQLPLDVQYPADATLSYTTFQDINNVTDFSNISDLPHSFDGHSSVSLGSDAILSSADQPATLSSLLYSLDSSDQSGDTDVSNLFHSNDNPSLDLSTNLSLAPSISSSCSPILALPNPNYTGNPESVPGDNTNLNRPLLPTAPLSNTLTAPVLPQTSCLGNSHGSCTNDSILQPGRRVMNGQTYQHEHFNPSRSGSRHTARPMSSWKSPLHISVENGHTNIVKLLLCQGADINQCDGEGYTPLHLATQCNNLDTMRLLLNHNADVDAQDSSGWSPLYHAAASGFEEGVKLLILYGALVAGS